MAVLPGLLAVSVASAGVMFWGGRMRRAASNPCLLIIVASLVFAGELKSQTYWRASSAIAGVTLGGASGLMFEGARSAMCGLDFSSDRDCRMKPAVPMAMALGYGLLGYAGGLHADRKLARGEELSRFTRFQLRGQLFLTPVILAPLAMTHVKPEPIRQKLTWAAVGGGAITGYLLQRNFTPALSPRTRVGIAPTRHGVTLTITAQ